MEEKAISPPNNTTPTPNNNHKHINMGDEVDKKPETGAVEHINLKVVGQVRLLGHAVFSLYFLATQEQPDLGVKTQR